MQPPGRCQKKAKVKAGVVEAPRQSGQKAAMKKNEGVRHG